MTVTTTIIWRPKGLVKKCSWPARESGRLSTKELAWIRRGAQARTTKAKGRIQRFQELEDNKLVVDETSLELNTISSRLGKKIIEIDSLSKAYGEKVLFSDFSYTLLRNDRIGIIGPNGCGKSTLLNTIMGRIKPDSGQVVIGDTVNIGYFSQENQALDETSRVIKYIADISDNIKTSEGSFSASQMLERFISAANAFGGNRQIVGEVKSGDYTFSVSL